MAQPVEVVEGPGRDALDWVLATGTLVATAAGLVALYFAFRAADSAHKATQAAEETARLGREQAQLLRDEALRQDWLRRDDHLLRLLDVCLDLIDIVLAYGPSIHGAAERVHAGQRRLRAAVAIVEADGVTIEQCRKVGDWRWSSGNLPPALDALLEAENRVREHLRSRPTEPDFRSGSGSEAVRNP